jgi:oligopeptidase B
MFCTVRRASTITTICGKKALQTSRRIRPREQALYGEMLARIQETDLSVPYPYRGYLYYTRTEEGKQYPIHCRTRDAAGAEEEVTLDLNALAEGLPFLSLGVYAVSDDGALLAYTTDTTGFREYTLRVKDLRTGELLPDTIEKVDEVEWSADGGTLFYTTEDEMKRAYRLCRHTLGSNDVDLILYEELDGLFRVFAHRSRDRKYLFFGSESFTETEVRFLPCDDPAGAPVLIRPREATHEYYADHRDGVLYLRTNRDAVNFRVVTAPVERPSEWTEFVAHRPAIMIADIDCFASHLVLSERADGLRRPRHHVPRADV